MKIYGIDFGTTKAAIATIKDGRIETVKTNPSVPIVDALHLWNWAIPSRVIVEQSQFSNTPNFRVASLSLDDSSSQNWCTFTMLKLKLGDPAGFQAEDRQELDRICPNASGTIRPEGLVAILMRRLKDNAEASETEMSRHFNDTSSVVIGVPADFGYLKRKALVYAARLAGFDEVKLLEEPLAAMLEVVKDLRDINKVMVIDFGGGTCNYAIFEIINRDHIRPVYANHVPIGGEHITDRIVRLVAPDGLTSYEKYQVRLAVENMKIQFGRPSSYTASDNPQARLQIGPVLSVSGEIRLGEITYEQFDQVIREHLNQVRDSIKRDVEQRAPQWIESLGAVVFLGESRRLYCFKEIFWNEWLEKCAGIRRRSIAKLYNLPEEGNIFPGSTSQAIVKGCATFGAYLHSKRPWRKSPYTFVTPRPIRIELVNAEGELLATRQPLSTKQTYLEEGVTLPQKRTLYFQLAQETACFEIRFRSYGLRERDASQDQDVPIEAFVIRPRSDGRFKHIPRGTFIWIHYQIRTDYLIEIDKCTARIEPFSWLSALWRRSVRDQGHSEQLALDIPLIWKTKLNFVDYCNKDAIDKDRNFYKLMS